MSISHPTQQTGRITNDAFAFVLAAWTSAVLTVALAGKLLDNDKLMRWGERAYEALDFGVLPFLVWAVPALLRLCGKVVIRVASFVSNAFASLVRVARRGVRSLYAAFGVLFRYAILPFITSGRQILWAVWNNPLLPLVASALTLYGAYLVHTGAIGLAALPGFGLGLLREGLGDEGSQPVHGEQEEDDERDDE